MSEPPRRFFRSASQLKGYSTCSERYRLQRMVKPKLPQRPASWLAMGTAFHTTFYEWEMSDRQIDASAYFDAEYDADIERLKESQPDLRFWMKPPRTSSIETDIKNRKAAGLKQVENYVSDALAGDWEVWSLPDGPPAVEVGFEVDLGRVTVIGYIDIVKYIPSTGLVMPSDLKTGNRETSFHQVGLYSYAVSKLFDVPISQGEFFYCKDRVGVIEKTTRYTEEYLTEIYESLDTGISNGVFIPNPTSACGLCGVLDYCREKGTLTPSTE